MGGWELRFTYAYDPMHVAMMCSSASSSSVASLNHYKFTGKERDYESGTMGSLPSAALSLEDVIVSPSLLEGMNPSEVEAMLGEHPGWKVETLGQGDHAGQGYVLREYLPNGEASGRMIRWHPGGGHHGPMPYWTRTAPNKPTVRVPAAPQ